MSTIVESGTIEPLLPQFGSSVRKPFLAALGFIDAAEFTSQPDRTCINQTDASGNPLPENNGNLLTKVNQIEPYSIARWIAQTTGDELDTHGPTVLRAINGVSPYVSIPPSS